MDAAQRASIEKCFSPNDLEKYLCSLGENERDLRRLCSFSPSVYDTAWLSMVYRKEGEQIEWLFPESFQYILNHQLEDGSWPAYASIIDSIVNTLAALLSLLTWKKVGMSIVTNDTIDLSRRIDRAKSSLQSLLHQWNVDETDRVRFEITVPSLLLQISHFGIHFEFPGQERLMQFNAHKTRHFCADLMYSRNQTPMLHSLEAFVGKVDFDKVRHHCSEENGVMGSPAATAAYLMNISTWDSRAELYLTQVVQEFCHSGAVPCAYPTCLSEISWAVSTLLMHQILPDAAKIAPVLSLLRVTLESQNGIVGFAPSILADADDTVRTVLTLQLVGETPDIIPMITNFRTNSGFKTYELERNPSFSSNCNVLLALGLANNINHHVHEIELVTDRLFSNWKAGNISDKWNTSSRFSIMLLSEALIQLLRRYDDGDLINLSEHLIQREIPLCLCQVIAHTLSHQNEDGSWESSLEATAYSVIALSRILQLPLLGSSWRSSLMRVVLKAQEYLSKHVYVSPRHRHDYIWGEKVSYSSSLLFKVYSITAIHTSHEQASWTPKMADIFRVSAAASKADKLFNKVPNIKQCPQVLRDIALLEAMHWSKKLYECKYTIFSKGIMQPGDDKYFQFIPLIWTTCNLLGNSILPPDILWDMILLSLLIYQVDEFMESIVAHMQGPAIDEIKKHISSDFIMDYESNNSKGESETNSAETEGTYKSHMSTLNRGSNQEAVVPSMSLKGVMSVLHSFTRHILHHPQVLRCSQALRKDLSDELCSFVLAHLTHIYDNRQLKAARTQQDTSNNNSSTPTWTPGNYYKWVHSTGAEDTSCPVSYTFFICLISGRSGQPCFDNPLARYTSQSVVKHLATMCRQYNDYGSAVRDKDEGNLNSLDFIDFWQEHCPGPNNNRNTDIRKQYPEQIWKNQLLKVAEFERNCMALSLQHLETTNVSQLTMKSLKVFIDVTDVFGQLYIHKDLTNRVNGQK